MKKKGFTLIELLAVIVILAIIALIATPIILNVIEDAKKSAAVDSAYGYIEAIEFNNAMVGVSEKYKNKKIDTTDDIEYINSKVEVKGNKAASGNVTIENGKVINANICIGGYIVEYKDGKAEAGSKCSNKIVEKENIDVIKSHQFEHSNGYTYSSSDESIATVDENGLLTVVSDGNVEIIVKQNGITIKKYMVSAVLKPFIFIECYNTGNGYLSQTILDNYYTNLTDGVYTMPTAYGALLMRVNWKAYVIFEVKADIDITFTSNYYKDGAGPAGQTAVFSKQNEQGEYEEYTSFQQVNNTQKYITKTFTKGIYKLQPTSTSGNGYIEFDEWDYSLTKKSS